MPENVILQPGRYIPGDEYYRGKPRDNSQPMQSVSQPAPFSKQSTTTFGDKFLYTFELSRSERYDNAVIKVIERLGDIERQKEFILSALLFYIRSPMYATQARLEDFSVDVQKTLGEFSSLFAGIEERIEEQKNTMVATISGDPTKVFMSQIMTDVVKEVKKVLEKEVKEAIGTVLTKELKNLPVSSVLAEERKPMVVVDDGASDLIADLEDKFF